MPKAGVVSIRTRPHAPTMPVRNDAVHLYLRDSDCPCELFFWVQEPTSFCERFFRGIPRSSRELRVNRHIVHLLESLPYHDHPAEQNPTSHNAEVWA